MPRVRDLLYRFRPSGAPGAATAAGVPADRALEQAVELEPVFGSLSQTQHDCAEIVRWALREAEAIRAREADTARVVLATARSLEAAERADAAARVVGLGRARLGSTTADSEREVAAVRQHAAEAMPRYVEQVVASVRSILEDGVPAPQHRAGAT
jgi:hypothetical protein